MKKMKTQMMIKCKNNKTEISRLWLPEILLSPIVRFHLYKFKESMFRVSFTHKAQIRWVMS